MKIITICNFFSVALVLETFYAKYCSVLEQNLKIYLDFGTISEININYNIKSHFYAISCEQKSVISYLSILSNVCVSSRYYLEDGPGH